MDETINAGISTGDRTANEAWRSLRQNLKGLLTLALQSRDLLAAIRETHPTLDAEMQGRIAKDLIADPAVQSAVLTYALGFAAPLPAVNPEKNSFASSPAESSEAPTDAPVIDSVESADNTWAN